MREQIHTINGVEICSEAFGNPANPAILLIMGATCSMVYWDAEFCQRMADTGRYVIRFDNRDVGRSVTYEPGTSHYTVADMADDAVGVLDAYGIAQAHIVGMSLGGMIGQVIAIKHPDRILTMTLIASSFFGSEDNTRNLPPMDERILAFHANAGALDWSDDEAVAHYLVSGSRLISGSKRKFDEKRVYKQVTTEIKRANQLLSMFNHALLTGDDFYEDKINEILLPTLVIHGTDDQVLPYAHGLALAEEIPHATLLTLQGTGHEIHIDDWDQIIAAIYAHTLHS